MGQEVAMTPEKTPDEPQPSQQGFGGTRPDATS
jgi:hypothetical protein